MLWWCWEGISFVVYVDGDMFMFNHSQEVWFSRVHISSMVVWKKDCVTRMLSLANEEPLGVVKSGIKVMWEIIS